MGGNLYMMDATRTLTAGAIDLGEKPAVHLGHRQATTSPSAAAQVVNDAMDIMGGKGICMGPSNFLGAALHADPGRDHRRGREHPDAQPDHLRPGRDPLPSVTC